VTATRLRADHLENRRPPADLPGSLRGMRYARLRAEHRENNGGAVVLPCS